MKISLLFGVLFCPLSAFFSVCIIVVEVNASGLPHVLKLCLGKQGHAPCVILLLHVASFLC